MRGVSGDPAPFITPYSNWLYVYYSYITPQFPCYLSCPPPAIGAKVVIGIHWYQNRHDLFDETIPKKCPMFDLSYRRSNIPSNHIYDNEIYIQYLDIVLRPKAFYSWRKSLHYSSFTKKCWNCFVGTNVSLSPVIVYGWWNLPGYANPMYLVSSGAVWTVVDWNSLLSKNDLTFL